jgi:cbb3-type cytochrome oxidase maturation protein
MESLYLLIPVSIVIVLVIGGLLAWSVLAGQFDDIDEEGRRILDDERADDGTSGANVKGPHPSSVRDAHSDRPA